MAISGMEDLPRELQQRTLARYHTLHQHLLPFVAGKALFTGIMLLLCSVIMLGGGGLIFRIQWQQPLALVTLTLAYAAFCVGVIAALVALLPNARGGTALTNIVAMALGLAGGCAFPPQQLPVFLREQISPLLPTYWYAEAVRTIQGGWGEVAWALVSAKLAVAAVALLLFAVWLLHRRLAVHR
jgi:ABC-type multidrug transport system permease subunit